MEGYHSYCEYQDGKHASYAAFVSLTPIKVSTDNTVSDHCLCQTSTWYEQTVTRLNMTTKRSKIATFWWNQDIILVL